MMRFRHIPIRKKLISMILITCLVALSVMSMVYMILEFTTYKTNLLRQVSTLTKVIAYNSSASLAFNSPQDAQEILNALKQETHIECAALFDSNGKIFAKFPANAADSIFPAKVQTEGFYFHNKHLMGIQRVYEKGTFLGTLYVKSDLKSLYGQLNQYFVIGILLTGFTLLLAYILSNYLQKSISSPIISLEITARKISEESNYTVRAIKYSNDEIGSLTDAFNQMLEQIEVQNKKIVSFNQELEKKVIARTFDLEKEKEFVETIINSSIDSITVLDTNLNILKANKTAYRYFNYSGDLTGKNIVEIIPDIVYTDAFINIKRALNGEYVHIDRYRSLVTNTYFESFYIPLKDNRQNVIGMLNISHDITRLISSQMQLEEVNSELMKTNHELEQFAYIASHDLQEPLRKIQTFTQLVDENKINPEQVGIYNNKIYHSANRMQDLIKDVLNYSKISTSHDAFIETDLNLILQNVKNDLELLIKEKNARIISTPLPTIKAIPLQMTQLFSNLIGNSLKYNNGSPEINITGKMINEKKEKNSHNKNNNISEFLELEFKDNGIGFEQEFSEKIFHIFQRLHNKQTYSGTGIGLGICKKIVENHHGKIFAFGEPEVGATFKVILPVNN